MWFFKDFLISFVCNVLSYIKGGDVKLHSLSTFHRLTSAIMFMVFSFSSGYNVRMNSEPVCFVNNSFSEAHDSHCETLEGPFVKLHTYYSWHPYVLAMCLLFSQSSHIYYKLLDGHTLQMFLKSIKKVCLHRKYDCECVPKYYGIKSDSLLWAMIFFISESFTIITPFYNFVCLNNMLLDGRFLYFGIEDGKVIHEIFPSYVICTFYKPFAGSIQNHDTICVLPINKLNTQIFLCIWWWLLFSATLSAVGIMWRLVTISCFRQSFFNRFLWYKGGRSLPNKSMYNLEKLSKFISFTEWLYMYYIYKNSNAHVIGVLMRRRCKDLNLPHK